MVQGLLRTLESSVRSLKEPIQSLHQAAYLLAGLTLVSQILALLRDRLFADAFGAGELLDVYYAAFKVPDLVFALVASLVSAYVLIPRIAGVDTKKTRELLSHASSFLLIGGGVLCAVLWIFMGDVLAALFPNLIASSHADAFILLSRVLLLQPLLLGLSGILTSVSQVERRFLLFSLSPVLYNLGIIAGVLFLYPLYGLLGIGMGVVVGASLHLLIHIPTVVRAHLFPRFVFPSMHLMGSVVRESIPRSLALSMGAVTTLVLAVIASRTYEGSIGLLSLAGNLEAVPLALIGASYATAAFPVLSEEANKGKSDAFKTTLSAAGRHLIFWSTVIAILTIVLRAHLVRALYGSGAFDWDATRLTAALLAVLVVGLTAQSIFLLASRAFYAARRSWLPLGIQIAGFAISVGSAVGLLSLATTIPELRYFVETLLRIEDVPGSLVVFVALGATLGQLGMGCLTLLALQGVAPGVSKEYVRPFLDGLAAGVVGGTAAYGLLAAMGNIAPLTSFFAVFTQGAAAGMVGFAASAAVLALLENREFRDLYESLRKSTFSKALTPSGPVLHDRSGT
ncbi:MAG: lipid II flippase MurJ [Minisyncoccia bacterium]